MGVGRKAIERCLTVFECLQRSAAWKDEDVHGYEIWDCLRGQRQSCVLCRTIAPCGVLWDTCGRSLQAAEQIAQERYSGVPRKDRPASQEGYEACSHAWNSNCALLKDVAIIRVEHRATFRYLTERENNAARSARHKSSSTMVCNLDTRLLLTAMEKRAITRTSLGTEKSDGRG